MPEQAHVYVKKTLLHFDLFPDKQDKTTVSL